MSRPIAVLFGPRSRVALIAAVGIVCLVAAPEADGYIYWSTFTGGTIGRANLDGSGVKPSLITIAGYPEGVAVDSAHVYWANWRDGTIGRANLDGSGVEQSWIEVPGGQPDPFGGSEGTPAGLAVDGAHIYWANSATGAIGRANLDGSAVEQNFMTVAVTGGPSNIYDPQGLAVDGAHVYWTNFFSPAGIGRANLDGSGVDQDLIPGISSEEVTVEGGHIYWTGFAGEPIGGPGWIGRANLDGSDVEEQLIIIDGNPTGVAVAGAHIYWARSWPSPGSIGRAKLDGSASQPNFISTPKDAWKIALDADITVTIKIKGKRPTLRRDGRVSIKLACPAGESSPPCTGILRLKTAYRVDYQGKERRVKLATARFSIGTGDTQTVKLRLFKRKAALVRTDPRARKLRVVARVGDARGNRATVAKRMIISPAR